MTDDMLGQVGGQAFIRALMEQRNTALNEAAQLQSVIAQLQMKLKQVEAKANEKVPAAPPAA